MSKLWQDGLKQMGYRVDVIHVRFVDGSLNISPKGGRTEVTLTDELGSIMGCADCSLLDNFNRKIGFQIAAGRALKAAQRRAKS